MGHTFCEVKAPARSGARSPGVAQSIDIAMLLHGPLRVNGLAKNDRERYS
jgi:hypothetical protein